MQGNFESSRSNLLLVTDLGAIPVAQKKRRIMRRFSESFGQELPATTSVTVIAATIMVASSAVIASTIATVVVVPATAVTAVPIVILMAPVVASLRLVIAWGRLINPRLVVIPWGWLVIPGRWRVVTTRLGVVAVATGIIDRRWRGVDLGTVVAGSSIGIGYARTKRQSQYSNQKNSFDPFSTEHGGLLDRE
jgi:hypothetical protein